MRLRQRRWLIEASAPTPRIGDASLITATCIDDDAQGSQVNVLWEHELDTEILDDAGWAKVGRKRFDDPELFAAYARTLRWSCVTATNPSLFQAPFRAGIRLDAYQLEPLRKALLLPRVNLLIADDVGLGKTIEAGLIMRELLLRRRVDTVVVACPPSMLIQWQDELWTRFGLRFTIVDRAFVAQVRRERGFAANPWATDSLFLISHRLLIDETYAAGLRIRLGEMLPRSLLILDEAHHAAPASGQKYAIDTQITRIVRDLAPRLEHRLFLTATPHNGHRNSFAALMEILDPQRFIRGMDIEPALLEPVMVRRLKEDLRGLGQSFPERIVEPVVLANLPETAPELVLARKLADYRELRAQRLEGESRGRRAEAELVWIGLQQRLLSSIEAFARTLSVHERSLRRLIEQGPPTARRLGRKTRTLLQGVDRDDDEAELDLEVLAAEEAQAIEAATEAGAIGSGDTWRRAIAAELAAVQEMRAIADAHRGSADMRVQRLLAWIDHELCPGISRGAGRWGDRRLLIFTEYEDTRRWLERLLREAVANTDRAEQRIATFTGSTPQDRREEVKAAFNAPPAEHPLRILIATDAAREGLNLQRHCADLFHLDLPWNPSRLEQRNGRIDRKLQPAPQVFCRYFVYTQRPEDRVLKRLVEKTETIRRQLGSAAPVLETGITELLARGIGRGDVARLEADIDRLQQEEKQRRAHADLEPVREADAALARSIEQLRTRLETSRRVTGVDRTQLRRVVTYGMQLAGAPPLRLVDGSGDAGRYALADEDLAAVRDPDLRSMFGALRRLMGAPRAGELRPVAFEPPPDTDSETVQLHLEHPLVRRLLDRFTNQGLVHHDLSRACISVSPDAQPRVVLMGRLSLWGDGAARLHEEIVRVAARWVEPEIRKAPLRAYARDAERDTMAALDRALDTPTAMKVPNGVQRRLLTSVARDLGELLPELEARAAAHHAEAVEKLDERGRAEAASMRGLLEQQRDRIQKKVRAEDDPQLRLQLDDPNERRQREHDRRAWGARLQRIARELDELPPRIEAGYRVKAHRLEPLGLVYLWPATG